MNKIILISKDVLRADYLPVYGNKYWKTPNIDHLAEKGTVFRKHYTAAPSTAMAVTSMFTGKYSFETNRKKYSEVEQYNDGDTLFDEYEKSGYKTHVIWPFEWRERAWRYSKVFHNNTKIMYENNFSENIKLYSKRSIKPNERLVQETINNIFNKILSIYNCNDKLFIWVHLPHVIKGRMGYGSDIDVFDTFIGMVRSLFNDNSIYITADHGHLNIEKGIPVYGFHVYEGAIKIPLITPRIDNYTKINFPTSNVQLKDIILRSKIERKDYIFSDSQYYMQENRRLAVIKENYKYIYNKKDGAEELYDLKFDPDENVNLLIEKFYDRNRMQYYKMDEIYYYPYWNNIELIYHELKQQKDRVWKTGNIVIQKLYQINRIRKQWKGFIKNIYNKHRIIDGLYGSRVKNKIYKP